jgi:hypothetical protein
MPAGFSGLFIESPLRSKGRRADLLLGTLAASGGRARLADARAWPKEIRQDSVWRGVLAFFHRWGDAGQAIIQRIPLALVELDLMEEAGDGLPRPGFHVCLAPWFGEYGWAPPRDAGAGDLEGAYLRALVCETLALASGGPPPSTLLGALARCHRALPPGGQLLHLSAMLSRPGSPFKLNALLPAGELARWLETIGWPGNATSLARWLDRLAPGLGTVKVDLSIRDELAGSIGFELSYPGDARREPRWRALLDALVVEDLCSGEQASALAAWPGESAATLPGLGWPALLERSLNIKIVLEGAEAAAKAYLGLTPMFSLLVGAASASDRPRPSRARARPARFPAFDALVGAAEMALPKALVSAAARRRLVRAAAALPLCCDSWCIECRLAEGDEQVDLLACITAGSGGREAWRPPVNGPLSGLGPLVARWKRAGSLLHRELPFIWLELDLPPGGPIPAPPSLYVGLEPRPVGPAGGALAATGWTAERLGRIVDEVVEATGGDVPRAARATAGRCVAALPPGAQLNCLGILRRRRTSALRLSLELPPATLARYLRAIRWPGPVSAVREVQPLLDCGVDRLALSLDAGARVSPYLGLELFYHRPPAHDVRFARMLTLLEERGWCASDKREALVGWRGDVDVPGVGAVARTVYHVKLTVRPDVPTFAKTYLWVTALARPRKRRG